MEEEINNNITFVADENIGENQYLCHYGQKYRSGRYPYGSGDNPYQHDEFLRKIREYRAQGMSEPEIAKQFKLSTTQLRAQYTVARVQEREIKIGMIEDLQAQGITSATEIAKRLGLKGESSVRALLDPEARRKSLLSVETADKLAELVDEHGLVDIGKGVEVQLGISSEKLRAATEILKFEGYEILTGKMEQQTNLGKLTTVEVVAPPGTPKSELYKFDQIYTIGDITSRDNGKTFEPSFVYPASMDSKRLAINYIEDGGAEKDGLIEIRRGVKDLDLNGSNYAQVRILVDGTHYMKGMAVYADDLPPGKDIRFNCHYSKEDGVYGALKKIKDDPENPFGSAIKENGGQYYYPDPNGSHTNPITGEKESLSLINKRGDEGDWNEWSKELASQFLSKQPIELINKQLNLSKNEQKDEYDEIMSLTNPVIKKSLLKDFADTCDKRAETLKAASLPNVVYKVILPVSSLKDDEIYAPHLNNGEQVALIRYPHGGLFEIPILTVNNNNKEAQDRMTKTPTDAVGIGFAAASKLSGADFDGDTVMVIPFRKGIKIKSQPTLPGLKDFDDKLEYGPDKDGIRIINGKEHYYRNGKEYSVMDKGKQTQMQMGIVSNLITDMTLKGASMEEKERAVKHSMVVIDAAKHKLDWKQSEIDNGIAELKEKYQTHYDVFTDTVHKGASTLLSVAKSPVRGLPERKEGARFIKETGERVELYDPEANLYINSKTGEIVPKEKTKLSLIDPKTGNKVYTETNREYSIATYKNSAGKKVNASVFTQNGVQMYKNEDGDYVPVTDEKIRVYKAKTESVAMREVEDAKLLSTGTAKEEAYADYANYLKHLANQARKEAYVIKGSEYSPSAKETYKEQVESLDAQLKLALLNKPKERKAQAIATKRIKEILARDEDLTEEEEGKMRQKEVSKARLEVGAKRTPINITDKEWEAIQAGAISSTKLQEIIQYADSDRLKQLAMPKTTSVPSPSKISRMKAMANSGYTLSEIAEAMGYSASTVSNYIKGGN